MGLLSCKEETTTGFDHDDFPGEQQETFHRFGTPRRYCPGKEGLVPSSAGEAYSAQ
jgi:hypothetical protein